MTVMPHPAVSRMAEDYLTLIWKAYEWPGSAPSTTDMAASLGVTPSSVSANLKKLARDGFIAYEPYGPIELTESGRVIAVEIVRRHRIIETYLAERLGLRWDQVHDEADRLEHAVSDLVLERMDAELGHPTADPHGDPIPTADGTVVRIVSVALDEAEEGARVRVIRISDRHADVLRYLTDKGVVLDAELVVVARAAAAGAMTVDAGAGVVELTAEAASHIRVTPLIP
jgi:DtxR family transcriptional regulator, Mn-dependent transcriptional regulator